MIARLTLESIDHRCCLERRRGFTLLELILAMLMIALLSLTLYTCLNIAYKAKSSAERAVLSSREALNAMDVIVRDLQGAMPLNDQTVNALQVTTLTGDFEATHDSMAGGDADTVDLYTIGFDSSTDAGPFAEGMRHVVITVRQDLDSPTLVRQITRNLLAQSLPTPDEEPLCKNIRSFSLKYWDGSAWQTDWDSEALSNVIPQQAQIDIVVAPSADKLKSRDTSGDFHVMRVVPLPMSKPTT